MEILEGIRTRKSIRKYIAKIEEKELDTVIRAGFAAPSAHNAQPWEFLIIREAKAIEKVAEMHKYAQMVLQAGTAILVCGDSKRQESESFLIQDCAAAIENMLLAAHGMGLGAVWCGIHGGEGTLCEDFSEYFKLPDHIIPIGLVVLGKKEDAEATARNRYNVECIHYDKW